VLPHPIYISNNKFDVHGLCRNFPVFYSQAPYFGEESLLAEFDKYYLENLG